MLHIWKLRVCWIDVESLWTGREASGPCARHHSWLFVAIIT